jgi:hypothetical protein
VAVPGPLTQLQVVLRAAGKPSSLTWALTMTPFVAAMSGACAVGLLMKTVGGLSLSLMLTLSKDDQRRCRSCRWRARW